MAKMNTKDLQAYINSQQTRKNQAAAAGETDLYKRLNEDIYRVTSKTGLQPTIAKTATLPIAKATTNPKVGFAEEATAPTPKPTTAGGNGGLAAPAPSAPPAAPAMVANSSPNNLIDGLVAARKNATLAALLKSRDAALSNLNAEKATIQPKYYDARNLAAAGSQQQARNLLEFMAARGGATSGANAQAELSRVNTLQGSLGALGRQETQAFADIARRTSDVQNAYASDVAGAEAGVEASRMEAMLNDYYQQQQRELQIAQLTGMLGGQRTLAGQSFDRGVFESDRNFNYNSGRDAINDSRYLDELLYNRGRDTVMDNRWQTEFDYGQKRDSIGDERWRKEFVEGNRQWQDTFNYNKNQDSINNSQQWASINNSKNSQDRMLDNEDWNRKLEIWRATGKAPEGIPGIAQGTPYGGQSSSGGNTELELDFQDDYAYVLQNPEEARLEFAANPQKWIQKYGVDMFNKLKAALPKIEK